MVPSERLQPVRRIAENREQEAARQLGAAQRTVKHQELRLEQLVLFQKEYQQRFNTACQEGLTPNHLLEFRAFLAKLQLAIQQQEHVVEHSRSDSQRKKVHWQDQHVRTQAIGKVIERYYQEESGRRERQEQKDTDERAQRRRVILE